MEICVLNSSTSLANNDVCFLVEACAYQLIEFCQAWGLDPWSVSFYSAAIGLPAGDIMIFEYIDKLDVDGALAYHSVDALGRPYGRMLPPSDKLDATDLSHEILETRGDPTADRWVKMPDGTELAVEVCDPVQGDSYSVATTVLGETRQIKLSNYVLPPFFDPQGKAPFDRTGTISAPFGMSSGGYEAVIETDGTETNVFAATVKARAASTGIVARKLNDPGSRLARRLRGRRAA